ncbi:hypothetical protein EMIHUDRAFT_442926, partial [Emiliania huxleyi CCMP1516]|uniref:Uncharacterized protein n=2 Tax=Emiliania huxleyi TaxID=2903 RepID=A0A0D3JYX2_EMIH1
MAAAARVAAPRPRARPRCRGRWRRRFGASASASSERLRSPPTQRAPSPPPWRRRSAWCLFWPRTVFSPGRTRGSCTCTGCYAPHFWRPRAPLGRSGCRRSRIRVLVSQPALERTRLRRCSAVFGYNQLCSQPLVLTRRSEDSARDRLPRPEVGVFTSQERHATALAADAP